MKKILTIAGYDPSSGAGITRDLDVFFSLGLHGLSALTAAVIQGPSGVSAVFPTPPERFASMLEAACTGVDIDAIKIGVVWDEALGKEITSFVAARPGVPVVIDPVSLAKNSVPLITQEGLLYLMNALFPLAGAITPNIDEASAITGLNITGPDDMKEAARAIHAMGPGAVVIKGGHLEGAPVDLLFDGRDYLFHTKRRIDKNVHGTGCMFSSALASFLAHGYPVTEAFFATQEFMTSMLNESYRIDEKGYFYSASAIPAGRKAGRLEALSSLRKAGTALARLHLPDLVPESQLDIGYAVMGAAGTEDVASFPGRIGSLQGELFVKSEPAFETSSPVDRMILSFMKCYPFMRSGMNLKFRGETVQKAVKNGMTTVLLEMDGVVDGSVDGIGEAFDSLVERASLNTKNPPDIIYDKGSAGKEPMIRLFARNPEELIKKMEIIGR
ncbi:MAG TPA: PfkB family carbohydrate kinase [Syntrophorhabdaceae bacterium]